MSSRSHLWLRVGAVALLAAMAVWPRPRAGASGIERAGADRRTAATHGVAARAETTAARLATPPRTAKLLVAEVDESL